MIRLCGRSMGSLNFSLERSDFVAIKHVIVGTFAMGIKRYGAGKGQYGDRKKSSPNKADFERCQGW